MYTKSMIDPELKKHLLVIENELANLRKETTSLRSSLVRGVMYGAGYVVGAVLIIVLIGWILNIVGVIPVFTKHVNEFREALLHVNKPIQ